MPDPAHIVPVRDFSYSTLREIIAHLEVSTDFDHLVYREAELDAIWSLSGYALSTGGAEAAHVHAVALIAHDLIADRRPQDAAAVLRTLL